MSRPRAAAHRSLTLALLMASALILPSWAMAEGGETVATPWGEIAAPQPPATVCATLKASYRSVHGSLDAVDADGKTTHPDQARLQQAIDSCAAGAVKLTMGVNGEDGFLTGPLQLKSGVSLWVAKGVTLYASRDPKDYDTGEGDCGTANHSTKKTCKPLIEMKDTVGSGLIGHGRIDGRGGSLLLSGENAGKRSWWDVAYQSKQGLHQHVFRLVQIDGGKDITLHDITLLNSPNFHVAMDGVKGLTAWGITILSPSAVYSKPGYTCPDGTTPDKMTPATCFTPDTVKNTDGFDPGQSSQVLLANSVISTGDDDVAIKAGDGPSRHMVFAHNHFYYGHGFSIGSETAGGVEDILVDDLTMDGGDSPLSRGLRLKSDHVHGGRVKDVVFRDICMRNEPYPLVFDTRYTDAEGPAKPDFTGIVLRQFHDTGSKRFHGGKIVLNGFSNGASVLPVDLTLDGVVFDGEPPQLTGSANGKNAVPAQNARLTLGPGPVSFSAKLVSDPAHNFMVSGKITDLMRQPADCAQRFVALSDLTDAAP
ncbi:glycoside hydrolase family 28 protein [Allorhizobium sp. BGMRC 0089]|uniref:glycoside hydrolase family 28 protein n=1 Tax=Allorhizobium sonneratiae TaxID=2934936 RepID=UPI0020342BD0|nr:glycoside hydrolase family 28 protein [Allorhizobium sonneratiae]MCM2292014.1 glycoside hydrolase family 28 protein [Allorhizobium sonneratiae]